jgi:dihydroorotase
MVASGLLDWAGVADRMSYAPARIAGLTNQGRRIEVGAPANLVLVDPTARAVVDPEKSVSLSRNNPFAGRELADPVVTTVYRGRPTVLHRRLVQPDSYSSDSYPADTHLQEVAP